jgi:thiol-disulfide isomerase/thioredoxin
MRLTPRSFLRNALIAAALLAPSALHAEPTAANILSQARTTAAAQHKNILLIFSASWCGPCHMFDHFLHDTPGAVDLRASLGGATAGYPYLIMLDPAGRPIINSLRPDPTAPAGGNIGYPSTHQEVDWFMQMLQKSAPTLTPQETATVHAWLTAHGS